MAADSNRLRIQVGVEKKNCSKKERKCASWDLSQPIPNEQGTQARQTSWIRKRHLVREHNRILGSDYHISQLTCGACTGISIKPQNKARKDTWSRQLEIQRGLSTFWGNIMQYHTQRIRRSGHHRLKEAPENQRPAVGHINPLDQRVVEKYDSPMRGRATAHDSILHTNKNQISIYLRGDTLEFFFQLANLSTPTTPSPPPPPSNPTRHYQPTTINTLLLDSSTSLTLAASNL